MKTQTKNKLIAFASPIVIFSLVALVNYALHLNVWVYGVTLVLCMCAVVLGLLKQLSKQTPIKSLISTILLSTGVLCLILLPIPSFKTELLYRWLVLSIILFGSIGIGRLLYLLFYGNNKRESFT